MKGKKNLPRGMSIAGIVCNVVALAVIVLWVFVFGAAAALAD